MKSKYITGLILFLLINVYNAHSYDFNWLRNCSLSNLIRTKAGKERNSETHYKEKLHLMDSEDRAAVASLYRDIILDIPDSYLAKKTMKGLLLLIIEAENEIKMSESVNNQSYYSLIQLRKKEVCTVFLERYPGSPGKSEFYHTEKLFLNHGLKIFIKSNEYTLAFQILENYFDTDIPITEFQDILLLRKAALLELICKAPEISRIHLDLLLDSLKNPAPDSAESIIYNEIKELDDLLNKIASMGRFGRIKVVGERFSKLPFSSRDRELYYKWGQIFTRAR